MAMGLKFAAISVYLTSYFFVRQVSGTEIGNRCLPGTRHKPKPSPEGPEYEACLIFKESSCCTANFTKQLNVPVIQKIGTFSWTLCGNLSKRCQDFMVGVECFYSCSPYVAHWEDKNETQAFNNAPVCSDYCDAWFEACKDDMTCARNWIKDMTYDSQGNNRCKNSTCRTFADWYGNGKGLCEGLWDDSFKYTTSGSPCLHFNFTGPHNPNADVVAQLFGPSSSPSLANTTPISTTPNSTTPNSTTPNSTAPNSTTPKSTTPDNGCNSLMCGLILAVVTMIATILAFS